MIHRLAARMRLRECLSLVSQSSNHTVDEVSYEANSGTGALLRMELHTDRVGYRHRRRKAIALVSGVGHNAVFVVRLAYIAVCEICHFGKRFIERVNFIPSDLRNSPCSESSHASGNYAKSSRSSSRPLFALLEQQLHAEADA